MRNAHDVVYEIINKSPRHDATFQTTKEQLCTDSTGIRTLCHTRWTVRVEALHSVISNYEALLALCESLDFVRLAEMRSRIVDVSASLKIFNFLIYCLVWCWVNSSQ